jgi:hypothetical protein
MLAIRYLVAVALAIAFSSSAFAQVAVKGHFRKNGTYVAPHYRSNPDGNFWNNWSTIGNVNPYTGELAGCSYGRIGDLASESYARPSYDSGACHHSRSAMYARRAAQMQQRREAEQERRERARASLPIKFYDDEELAKVRYDLAHKLYKNGNPEASKRWLEKLVKDYSSTQTADRARETLARFDSSREPVSLVAAIGRRPL